jgi:hypothetical protein
VIEALTGVFERLRGTDRIGVGWWCDPGLLVRRDQGGGKLSFGEGFGSVCGLSALP